MTMIDLITGLNNGEWVIKGWGTITSWAPDLCAVLRIWWEIHRSKIQFDRNRWCISSGTVGWTWQISNYDLGPWLGLWLGTGHGFFALFSFRWYWTWLFCPFPGRSRVSHGISWAVKQICCSLVSLIIWGVPWLMATSRSHQLSNERCLWWTPSTALSLSASCWLWQPPPCTSQPLKLASTEAREKTCHVMVRFKTS